MKESFEYRWGGRERLKKPEFGEKGVEEREMSYVLPVENSCERF
jgi:hypothetical protein